MCQNISKVSPSLDDIVGMPGVTEIKGLREAG
jgi:hypothetical protein